MTTQNPVLPNERDPITSRWWRNFFQAIQSRSPTSGTATFAAGTSIAVTLNPALPDDEYNVLLDAPENKIFWTTVKTTTGFTINASGSTSVTVGYTIVRR